MTIKMIKLSKQAMFNKAIQGLAKQRWQPSFQKRDEGGTCVYGTYGGKRCPVGHLLPASVDTTAWDRDGGIIAADLVRLGYFPKQMCNFLQNLQEAHDDVALDDKPNKGVRLRENLRQVAEDFGLKLPPQLKGNR